MFASQTDVWQINSLSQPNRNQSSYWGYLISGIEHILSGWDHLAFLLGLILLYQGRNLVIAITGFTIGHSLTLGLGAMNVLRVKSGVSFEDLKKRGVYISDSFKEKLQHGFEKGLIDQNLIKATDQGYKFLNDTINSFN